MKPARSNHCCIRTHPRHLISLVEKFHKTEVDFSFPACKLPKRQSIVGGKFKWCYLCNQSKKGIMNCNCLPITAGIVTGSAKSPPWNRLQFTNCHSKGGGISAEKNSNVCPTSGVKQLCCQRVRSNFKLDSHKFESKLRPPQNDQIEWLRLQVKCSILYKGLSVDSKRFPRHFPSRQAFWLSKCRHFSGLSEQLETMWLSTLFYLCKRRSIPPPGKTWEMFTRLGIFLVIAR